jgi:hypothetical protein
MSSLINLILTVLWLILFIWALLDILKAHKSTEWKVLWAVICLIFPVAGSIVYYLFARQKDMNLPEDFQK